MSFRFLQSVSKKSGVVSSYPAAKSVQTVTASLVASQTVAAPPSAVQKVAKIEEETEVTQLTKRYLELSQRYRELEVKNLLDQMEQVKKTLAQWIPAYADPEEEIVFGCSEGEVHFSPCSHVAEVMNKSELIQEIIRRFGWTTLLSLLRFSLTELRKVMSEKELEPFLEKKRGSRSIHTHPTPSV